VEIPVLERLRLDDAMLPTGEREPVRIAPGRLGSRTFDDAYVAPPEGAAFALAGGGRRIELAFETGYPYAQVFAPPDDDLIAFEPMTAPTDALTVGGPQLVLLAPGDAYRAAVRPGQVVLSFDGPDESVAQLLQHQVFTKEVWLAALLGEAFPQAGADEPAGLVARQEAVAGRWLAMLRDMERRDAWDDRIVDALCDPPESFVLGSIVAHVLTFGAHRRLLVRAMLREHGVDPGSGDPIDWLARRHQEDPA